MPNADSAQLRALVEAYFQAGEHRHVLAVKAEPFWDGPALIDGSEFPIRVDTAASPLAFRDALRNAPVADNGVLVVLTNCVGADLGLDVRARLIKGDVISLDPYAALRGLFRAEVLDPALVEDRWLVDDLVALAPLGGWQRHQPLGGVLDVDHAWRIWQEARLGLAVSPDGLEGILRLAMRPEVLSALRNLPPERLDRLADRWGASATGPSRLVVHLLAAGHGSTVLAVAIAAGVLWAPSTDPEVAAKQAVARARLEYLLGRDVLDPRSAAELADAAWRVIPPEEASAVLDGSEHLLAQAGAADLAVLSNVLPAGFDLRLARLGRALGAGDVQAAAEAVECLRAHAQATAQTRRVQTAEAALCLLRHEIGAVSPPATSFVEAVTSYATEGSWEEQARRLVEDGDAVPELANACSRLADSASTRRREEDLAFASFLAEWSLGVPTPCDAVVPVESLLSEVVVPIARAAPVLLVVCDGMGLSVSHQLTVDLLVHGWAPARPADLAAGWPLGVAALPTVTEASRSSLLTGHLGVGGQAEEREGFAAHPGLRAASPATRPPMLFHKADLVGPSGDALGPEVASALSDPEQRVVGVVVNAIDDHLARGDQVVVNWGVDSIRPLRWLLDAAAEAGRVLVLTSDHGHVLRRPETRLRRPSASGGERWRLEPPEPEQGEIRIRGLRVVLGGGSVVLPWDDRILYGTHKHGYHGGATAEEALVAIAVHARSLPDGWVHHPEAVPSWWSGVEQEVGSAPSSPAALPSAQPASFEPRLFDPEAALTRLIQHPSTTASPPTTWVDRLLTSPAFVAYRQRSRLPRPLDDERLRRYLTPVALNGNVMPLAALSVASGEAIDTLRMGLSQVQRLLNVDGAEVLALRADGTVEVNAALLSIQFDLPAP